MNTFFKHWSVRRKLTALTLLVALAGANTVAFAKMYACGCSYSSGGAGYDVAYSSSGAGCCSGYANNGAGYVTKTYSNGTSASTYCDGSFAQSMCCGY